MFDIGFFELVVIGIVALLVLGPERLPHAVRMTGAWVGKIRRATQAVRDEFEREVNAQELQRRLREEMEKTGLNETRQSLEGMQEAMKKNLLEQEGTGSTSATRSSPPTEPASQDASEPQTPNPADPARHEAR